MKKFIFALDILLDTYAIEKTGKILAISPEDIGHVIYSEDREDREAVAWVHTKGGEFRYKVLASELNKSVEKWFKKI